MSSETFHPRGSVGRVRPALLAALILVQALCNVVGPGLGIAFLVLLLWGPARRSRIFVALLIVVATLSAVFLVGVVTDFLTGPAVEYSFD